MTIAGQRDIWIWMDISATCNLSCRDCYTKAAHEPFVLTRDRFRRTLEHFQRPDIKVHKLHLNWRGEPFINRHLVEMLGIKREILDEVPLEFHTHGLLLNPGNAAAIIDATGDSDRLYVSIDGGWPDLHEANRGKGTWAGALEGLRLLLDARDAAGRSGPVIGIYQITYSRRTLAHADLVALGRRCDEWTRVSPIEQNGEEASFAAERPPSGPCFWAGNALCITARGDVHVCLLSFRPDGKLGNLMTDGLDPILTRAAAFRAGLRTGGRASVPHCRACLKTEGAVDASG